jgi:hypothetical protein
LAISVANDDPERPCGLRAACRVLPPALLHRLIVLAGARTCIGRLGVPIALEKEAEAVVAFFVPGFAKFVVIKKPATKERSGINPFTKEPTIFKAKPARKIIRARPVKAAKDAVS